jgi:hypothetical protein
MFRRRDHRDTREEEAVRRRAAAARIDAIMRERLARGEQAFAEEIERRRKQSRRPSG